MELMFNQFRIQNTRIGINMAFLFKNIIKLNLSNLTKDIQIWNSGMIFALRSKSIHFNLYSIKSIHETKNEDVDLMSFKNVEDASEEELIERITYLRDIKKYRWKEVEKNLPGLSHNRIQYLYRNLSFVDKLNELKKENQWPFNDPEYRDNFWKAEDDEKLIKSYNKYNNFFTVAKHDFPHKRPISLKLRYDALVSNKGKFLEEESKKFDEAYSQFGNNWTKIADYIGTRSPVQCFRHYHFNKVIDKNNVHERWTVQQTNKLKQLIEKYGTSDWHLLAKEFGPSKNHLQLQTRYYYKLKSTINKEPWTKEEDNLLTKLINKYGFRKWKEIAKEMKGYGRTSIACFVRWQTINPALIKGEWTQQEIELLLKYAKEYDNKWTIVSQYVTTRSSYDCEKKWYQIHLPNLRQWNWSQNEKDKLLELAIKFNRNWGKVALELGTRTPWCCRSKYRSLIKVSENN